MTTSLDARLSEAAQKCHSAAFSDICDQVGLRKQTLPANVRRMAGSGTIVGRARTFTTSAVSEIPERHYGGEIDFVDSLTVGDVAIGRVDADAAGWGELFSTAAMARGASGLVIEGLIRDLDQIRALGFSVHATGTRPTDALGRVSLGAHDDPVRIGDVTVRRDDLIVADEDGVTIVPSELTEEVLERALAKTTTEQRASQMLSEGGTLGQMWDRFRVM